jgi:hypothetical protein
MTSSNKATKHQYSNALNIQELQKKALQRARADLSAQGLECPLYDGSMTGEENYERMRAYSEKEAALVVQYMRTPSGPRPIVFDSTQEAKPKEWSGYND